LNLREAKEHEDNTSELLQAARADYDQASTLLATASADRDSAYRLVLDMHGRIEELEDEKAAGSKQLAAQRAAAEDLDRKLRASAARAAALENDLRASEQRHETQSARAAALGRKLEDTEARLKTTQATADLVPRLRADLKSAREEYAQEAALAKALEKEIAGRLTELKEAKKGLDSLQAAKAALERDRDRTRADKERLEKSSGDRIHDLEKELATAQRSITALEGEVGRVRAAAENRFAGITLTGRRVVFLVDMSGSMDRIDEDTPAPNKWREVRETVIRLMRSLPDLEKYQVITFAERVAYPLGGAGGWFDYDPKASADRALRALARVEPKGGTNMYDALDAAFRLRDRGLDTIYLLSDGLPNLGEGLPRNAGGLGEVERNNYLAKHIRRTLKGDWNRPLPNQPRVRINAVGFFFESPDVGAFLWALARENDGSFVGMSRP
jgi:hypothetical protein